MKICHLKAASSSIFNEKLYTSGITHKVLETEILFIHMTNSA